MARTRRSRNNRRHTIIGWFTQAIEDYPGPMGVLTGMLICTIVVIFGYIITSGFTVNLLYGPN